MQNAYNLRVFIVQDLINSDEVGDSDGQGRLPKDMILKAPVRVVGEGRPIAERTKTGHFKRRKEPVP